MTNINITPNKKPPLWFRLLNFSFLLPTIVWPLIFFVTIFFFDNPKNLFLTFLLFLFVNAYPLYLFIVLRLNLKLYHKNATLATIFPIAFCLTFLISIYQLVGGINNIKKIWNLRQSKSQTEIVTDKLGSGYTVDSNYVYKNDTIVAGADPKTFECVNWEWSKDSKSYFFQGKLVPYIDYNTFHYLDYNYAIDKNNVYYDDSIIEGADATTFKHIEGTQDGKDKNSCYRYGEKVDCNVLLTEE